MSPEPEIEMTDHNGASHPIGQGEGDPRPEPVPPLFEVIIPSSLEGAPPLHHFKFWGDGTVEGFEGLAAHKKMLVLNRVPMLLDSLANPLRGYVAELNAQIDQLAHTEAPAGG